MCEYLGDREAHALILVGRLFRPTAVANMRRVLLYYALCRLRGESEIVRYLCSTALGRPEDRGADFRFRR
jgi:hypothetical protein